MKNKQTTPKKQDTDITTTTPKKQRMDNEDRQTVTFQVKKLGDIITSPWKQKDGTHVKWFQFAAVTKEGTNVMYHFTLHCTGNLW